MDLKEHFTEVVRYREDLQREFPDGAVYLVSLEKKQKRMVGGRVCVANPHVAALMIAQETHRVAKPEEANAWIADQNKKGAQLLRVQARKDSKGQPTLGETVKELVQAIQLANSSSGAPAPVAAAVPPANTSAPPPNRQHGRPAAIPQQGAQSVTGSETVPPAA